MRANRIGIALTLLIVTLMSATARATVDGQKLCIAVDPRVELMSIIFRLAGNPEYNQGRLKAYLDEIDAHFGPHREHAAVQLAQQLRRTRGVSFDAVMSMAVHLNDGFELAERVPLDGEGVRLDERWRVDEARQFLEQARDFVRVSDFRGFMQRHQAMHELAAQRMTAMIDQHADLPWFDAFFGARPGATFTLIPAPVNGGQAYGPSVRLADGGEELFAIIGVWQVDEQGQPQFDKGVLPTVIHEFCHSYVNHVVGAHAEDLRPAGERIFPLVDRAMRRQAYGNWRTMMNESVVRAAVVRYLMAHDKAAAARQQQEEQRRGFLWMNDLVALLDQYETDRERYPTLDAFMPQVVKFFDDLAPRMEAAAQRDGQDGGAAVEQNIGPNTPRVASVTPANGASDVDPATQQIIIIFDRPMRTEGYSVMLTDKGQDAFPQVLSAGFDEAGRVFTIQVRLKPGWSYEFTLNSETGGAFQSADGVRLPMTLVRFKTRGE